MAHTHEDWLLLMHPDVAWQTAYKAVGEAAIQYLSTLAPSENRSTRELAEALYPDGEVRGFDGAKAKKRIYKALAAIGDHDLKEYASRGAPISNYYGTLVRPWLWHSKHAVERCPHCHQFMPVE